MRKLVRRARRRRAARGDLATRSRRIATWRGLPTVPGAVALVGDSIAADFPTELLTPLDAPLLLRCCPSETIRQLTARVDETLSRQPRTVVVLTGINDVFDGRRPAAIAVDYRALLDACRAALPEAQLIAIGVPPVARTDMAAATIQEVNAALAAAAASVGGDFVDTLALLADADGRPAPGMAAGDGVHLTGAGYTRLARALRSLLPAPRPAAHSLADPG